MEIFTIIRYVLELRRGKKEEGLGAALERKSKKHGKELMAKIGTIVVRQKFITFPHPDVGFNFGTVHLLRNTDRLLPICLVATAQVSVMKSFIWSV